jgi:hypothetical protein
MLEFGCLQFDSSPIFIAKGAPSSNEMSTNLFQGHDPDHAPFASRLPGAFSTRMRQRPDLPSRGQTA